MAQVDIVNLVKTYAGVAGPAARAVDGVNLTIRDREFMVLVGPSGCGKSTTLRMVAGLESISEGTIAIDGRVVNDVPPKDRDIAMVFQNYALYPHMSVFDNLAFGLKLRGVATQEIRSRVHEAAELLGLTPYLDRKPKALSGGQRQRVAVGRAIVRRPKVFLFDEPLSNLDAKMRAGMRAEISRLHRQLGATMIYVTHDQVEAMTMGDRICVMNGGRIMQVAAPLDLYHQPANLFVAGFIGSPPINLVRGRLAETGPSVSFSGDSVPLNCPLPGTSSARASGSPGQPVILGIRPEDLRVGASAGPHAIDAVVDVAEPMGAETYLHLKAGTETLVARVHPADAVAPGKSVRVGVDATRLHLFDATTEQALPR